MKTKIILSSIAFAIAIMLIACGLFGSEKKQTAFDIRGQWLIDSIANKGSDSAANLGLLVLALAGNDSTQLGIQFNSDSSFQYLDAADSTMGTYYFSEDSQSLFLKEDSVTTQFNFISKSDTAFVAATTDSLVYYLKRK